MSEAEEPPNEIFNVRASSEFEDDDEALEALVQLKELDFGQVFNNRETELDTEDGEGISIQFSHDDKYNSLTLASDEDSDITISLRLGEEDIGQASAVLEKVIGNMKDVTIEVINIYKIFDVHFNNLQLPIEKGTDHQVVGLRIEQGKKEFIIQQSDDEKTSVNMWLEEPEEDTESIVNNIGQKAIDSTTEFIESFN